MKADFPNNKLYHQSPTSKGQRIDNIRGLQVSFSDTSRLSLVSPKFSFACSVR